MALSDWFISPAGQAWAAWTSSFFSIVAIGLALNVFIEETKRSNQALEREAAKDAAAAIAARDREAETLRQDRERVALKRHAFITACIDLAIEARRSAAKAQHQLTRSDFIDTDPNGPLPHLLEPMLDYAHALQLAAPTENEIALLLARLTRTLKDFVEYRGLRSVPARTVFNDWIAPKLLDLDDREASFRVLLARLPAEYPGANLPN